MGDSVNLDDVEPMIGRYARGQKKTRSDNEGCSESSKGTRMEIGDNRHDSRRMCR